MARKTTVELVDDLTGEVATESVSFGIDGVEYSIDLTEKNAEKLREVLSVYVDAGQRVAGRKRRGAGSTGAVSDAPKVRAWAKENGIEVPERGRIPADVRKQYEEATAG